MLSVNKIKKETIKFKCKYVIIQKMSNFIVKKNLQIDHNLRKYLHCIFKLEIRYLPFFFSPQT